jgi:DNA topoisomerase-2
MAEVLPSPQGKRVIPQVTVEMKAEAEKKIKKKIKVILENMRHEII